ncbi:MAG: hypothetical protein IGS03_13105 [Candidatus Sericytochromatia bacterium]|nr:hypothetical protein [Candidatus Sericytochromatia bacterium]
MSTSTDPFKPEPFKRKNLVFVFAPILLWLGLKLSTNLWLAWLGLGVSVLGGFFALHLLNQFNQQMNRISELPEAKRPQHSFTKPLTLAAAILLLNLTGIFFFIQYSYFPHSQNSASIFIVNQSDETIENIVIQYGQLKKVIDRLEANQSQELVFPKQKNVPVTVSLKADDVERRAEFGLDPKLSMSAIRIDPLKNILPDL